MKKMILATVALTALIGIASTDALAASASSGNMTHEERSNGGLVILGVDDKESAGPGNASASAATSAVVGQSTAVSGASAATLQSDTIQSNSVYATFKIRASNIYSGIVDYFGN